MNGAPQPEHDGDVFNGIDRLSGRPQPSSDVTETVVVDGDIITSIWDAIKKGIWR